MDFMTMVKERWLIFLVIGLFFVVFIAISELSRRSEKKKAAQAQLAATEQKEK